MSPGACNAEHLVPQEALDNEQGLNILRPVATLPALGSLWIQKFREFPLPITEGMNLDTGDHARRANRHRSVGFGLGRLVHGGWRRVRRQLKSSAEPRIFAGWAWKRVRLAFFGTPNLSQKVIFHFVPTVQVRLQELVPAFHNGGRAQFYLDKETGQVLMDFEACMYNEQGEDIHHCLVDTPSRFIAIESIGSRETMKMMRDFIQRCSGAEIKPQLEEALNSQRPFQNFRNVVSDNFECRKEWLLFEEEYTEKLAHDWLREHHVDAELVLPEKSITEQT